MKKMACIVMLLFFAILMEPKLMQNIAIRPGNLPLVIIGILGVVVAMLYISKREDVENENV